MEGAAFFLSLALVSICIATLGACLGWPTEHVHALAKWSIALAVGAACVAAMHAREFMDSIKSRNRLS